MRTAALITACLLALTQSALGQSVLPHDGNAGVLTIRISADGICHFLDTSIQCAKLGHFLVSKNLAPDGHIHILVDRTSQYELVAATLQSLQSAGFGKVRFINSDFAE